MKKIWAGLLAGVICTGFAGCTVTNVGGITSINQYENGEKYSVGNFSYAAAEVKKVQVDWVAGEIHLIQSGSDTLHAEETGELTADQQLHWLLEEGVLTLRYCASGYAGTFPANGKALTLEIPTGIDLSVDSVSGGIVLEEGTFGEMKLDTTSGAISLGTVSADVCKLDAVSGSIAADKLLCAEKLKADTTSGRIRLDWVEAPIADLCTVSGGMEMRLCKGQSAELETTSGDIKLTLEAGKDVELETTSGSITLKLGETLSGAAVDFDSVSGALHGDGYYMEGGRHIFGDGSCQIQVETTSGNLTIQ